MEMQKHSTENVMLNLATTLIRDFQQLLNDPLWCAELAKAFRQRDIRLIREEAEAIEPAGTVVEFKTMYQMKSLLKRFRFQDDIHSVKTLTDEAVTSFVGRQNRLRTFEWPEDRYTLRAVHYAKDYIKRILGSYDSEEHCCLSQFGSRASVGVRASMACEAARWELPISGSEQQASWFVNNYLPSRGEQLEAFMIGYINRQASAGKKFLADTAALRMTLVPKTFKSLRSIMPNTTLGSLHSDGMGRMMALRLKENGYDIRRLQIVHRHLARRASINGCYVTADQSAASDNISCRLVKALLPSDWFQELLEHRIGHAILPGLKESIEMETFSTMGCGYTFPLQTLVFLALLKGIDRAYCGGRSLISVYGDDMIYDQSLHKHVLKIFPKLGLQINESKTFCSGNFRESCGGDYYHGEDVRPFQPKTADAVTKPQDFEAFLYKLINGILLRWSEYSVPQTLTYLLSELHTVREKFLIVPCDFPEDAGIKVDFFDLPSFLDGEPLASVRRVGACVRFNYLALKPKQRVESRHEPYYWRMLNGCRNEDIDYSSSSIRASISNLQMLINSATGVDVRVPVLRSVPRGEGHVVQNSFTGRIVAALESRYGIPYTGSYALSRSLSFIG